MRPTPRPFVRWLYFNGVGALGLVVQLGLLAWLESGVKLNYLGATALAVEAAVLNNFLWHERVTWRDRERRDRLGRLIKFHLTNGAMSVLGNVILMRLLVGTFALNHLLANLLAITACSLANFYLGDRFVFARAIDRDQCL